MYFVYLADIYYRLLYEVIEHNINQVKSFFLKKIRNGVFKMKKNLHPSVVSTADWIDNLIKQERKTSQILKSIRKNGLKRNFYTENERNLVSNVTESIKYRIELSKQ